MGDMAQTLKSEILKATKQSSLEKEQYDRNIFKYRITCTLFHQNVHESLDRLHAFRNGL